MKKVPRKKIKNIARGKPITRSQAMALARNEINQVEFLADTQQVMQRISKAPQGLRNGSPPPRVS